MYTAQKADAGACLFTHDICSLEVYNIVLCHDRCLYPFCNVEFFAIVFLGYWRPGARETRVEAFVLFEDDEMDLGRVG